jgi:opacity protein-like surface antigen
MTESHFLKGRSGVRVREILLALLMVILSAGAIHAQEKNLFLVKKNSLSVKAGYHIYPGSEYTDYWRVNQRDYGGPAAEIAYERELITFLGLEIALGFYRANQAYNYSNLVLAGDSASLEATLSNTYLSLSLKPHIPIGNDFQVYFGAGADLYYTLADFKGSYLRGSSTVSLDETDSNLSVGFHGMGGVEYLFWRPTSRSAEYDIPVSFFLEYKYSYVPIEDFDKKVVDRINSLTGSSVNPHQFDAGGHLVFLGLRWRF